MTAPRNIPAGPQPLPLHLAMGLTLSLGSKHGWLLSKTGSLQWSDANRVAAAEVTEALAALPNELADAAIDRAARSACAAFLAGIERLRQLEPSTGMADAPGPPVWQEGTTRLLAYGTGRGVPVLLIPSLINRASILDLLPNASLCRWLATRGFDPYLVDWDAPGSAELAFDLAAYVTRRLDPIVAHIRAMNDSSRPALVGYCMGGLLALGLAQRQLSRISSLTLIATPWDTHVDDRDMARRMAAVLDLVGPAIDADGALSGLWQQVLFASLDPAATFRKLVRHGESAPGSTHDDTVFRAVERWLNDTVPLAAPAAVDCLRDWYRDNAPAQGRWSIDGQVIDPRTIDVPSLTVLPSNDRIVPQRGARVLARLLPNCRTLSPRVGHVGVIVAQRARRAVWTKLSSFLANAARHG